MRVSVGTIFLRDLGIPILADFGDHVVNMIIPLKVGINKHAKIFKNSDFM